MFLPKRVVGILLSIILIFTNTSVYSHPENLAADSLFNLWKKKGIDPKEGFIVTERLTAIHRSISQGRRTPEDLNTKDIETVQRHTNTQSLREYPFDYNLSTFRDKRIWGMMNVKIYKDKYGDKQLVLFYDPKYPPWDLLREFGVKTDKDREFAKRGFWITYNNTAPGQTRRVFLALAALFATHCVFDLSGLPAALDGGITPDAGPATDGGTQPINTIEQDIQITVDNDNSLVTTLPNSTYTSGDTSQHLSGLPQFVRNNNAAFRYNGRNWHWVLSESDRTNIINNGLTYLFNGRNHKIKLIGEDNTGHTKTIIFNPQIPRTPNYDQPYRVTISSVQINQLAQQIGLDLKTINVHFENLEPERNFILNGFQLYYAVKAQSDLVEEPTVAGVPWTNISTPGSNSSITITPQGTLLISYRIETDNNNNQAGIKITPLVSSDNNIAPQAIPTASSEDPNFPATNATNGSIGPNLGDEWASNGELTPWIQLTWGEPKLIHKIVLYDRVNLTDHIANSLLEFSDGTTVPVGELPNDGSPITITFLPKTVTWVRFRVLSAAPGSVSIGLSEIKAFELVPQSIPELLSFNCRSNSPFLLQLRDTSRDLLLQILITGINPDYMNGVSVNLSDAIDKTQPQFNLPDALEEGVSIIIPSYLIPEDISGQSGETEIDGLVDTEIDTRLGYATDDPDIEPELYEVLIRNMRNITKKEQILTKSSIPVFGIQEWSQLSPGGLEFISGKTTVSAFTTFNPITGKPLAIYIPHPDIIRNKIKLTGITKTKVLDAITDRQDIILGHEQDEAIGRTAEERRKLHLNAVLNEFQNSINGLNRADIITVLLKVLIDEDSQIHKIDNEFHRRFITALLTQGMTLTYSTYYRIIYELIDARIDENTYKDIIQRYHADAVRTLVGKEFTYNKIAYLDIKKLHSDPRFQELLTYIDQFQIPGHQKTIYIDLDRFLIENTALTDSGNVVVIDTEYLKRFIAFARNVEQHTKGQIKIIGVTTRDKDSTSSEGIVTAQLLALVDDHLKGFSNNVIYGIRFNDYLDSVVGSDNLDHTVSILGTKRLNDIPEADLQRLRIITPILSNYNWVNNTEAEFRAAIEGVCATTRDEFKNVILKIVGALLDKLVKDGRINTSESKRILDGIKTNGIGTIPAHYDPLQYYRSIKEMKNLLISA